MPINQPFANSTLAEILQDGKAKAKALSDAQAAMESWVAGVRSLSVMPSSTTPPAADMSAMWTAYLDTVPKPYAEYSRQLLVQLCGGIDTIRQAWDAAGQVAGEAATPKAIRVLVSLLARVAQG